MVGHSHRREGGRRCRGPRAPRRGCEGPLHRHGLQAPDVPLVGPVQCGEHEQRRDDHSGDGARHHALHDRRLPAVGEEEQVEEDEGRGEEQHDPDGQRHDAFRRVQTVPSTLLAGAALGQPGIERALLARGLRLGGLQGSEHGQPPWIDRSGLRLRAHRGPLSLDDGASVADQLARETGADVRRHQLGGLELLHDQEGFRFRTAPRVVVLRECQEDDESQQQSESGREHAEDSGCAVAVLEAAALGSAPPHEQHHGDHHRRHPHDDQPCPDEIHPNASSRGGGTLATARPGSIIRPGRCRPPPQRTIWPGIG